MKICPFSTFITISSKYYNALQAMAHYLAGPFLTYGTSTAHYFSNKVSIVKRANQLIFSWGIVNALYITLFVCIFSAFFTVTPLPIIKILQVSWIISICNDSLLAILCWAWLRHNFDTSPHVKQLLVEEHHIKTLYKMLSELMVLC